jgi:hypothetical protein
MNTDCRRFRELLAAELASPANAAPPHEARAERRMLQSLSWHEHLSACGACRDLLAAEEALELLLASLPEPKLPPALAERVLARLHAASALDRLLERDDARAPEELAARVLAGLRSERAVPPAGVPGGGDSELELERRLDRLLERDRAREPAIPAGLAGRVLARLGELERAAAAPAAPSATRSVLRSRWLYALAASLIATLALALWLAGRGAPERADRTAEAPREAGPGERAGTSGPRVAAQSAAPGDPKRGALPDEQMLGALDVLEHWDLLMHEDVDVLLSTIDPAEQWLIEYQSEAAPAPEPEKPSKG